MKTEFGKTFEDMKDVETRRTPLQLKMDELGKQLSILSFVIIGVIALVGVLQVRGHCTLDVSVVMLSCPLVVPHNAIDRPIRRTVMGLPGFPSIFC